MFSRNLKEASRLAQRIGRNQTVVYEREVNSSNQTITFTVEEKMIYGSSRLGVLNDSLPMLGSQNSTYTQSLWSHVIGKRTYELANHLGNVLSVISDKVIPHNNGGNVDYYMADNLSREERIGIRQAQEESALADEDETATNVSAKAVRYSPFGVTLYGRNFSISGADGFRYGFQGQEMDDEIKGEGNSVNYKYRMHDPRVGRFFAVDPLAPKYPQWTPYQFGGNQVISSIELEGLEPSQDLNTAKPGLTYQGSHKGDNSTVRDRIIYNWKVHVSEDGSRSWVQDGTTYEGPTKEENASMSKHVYSTNLSGVKVMDAEAGNYRLIKKYGGNPGFKAGLYVREIDGVYFYTLAFAGTDDLSDASDDISTGRGEINKQLVFAAVVSKGVNKWVKGMENGNNLSFTGHSLGGGLAAIGSFSTGRKSTTFNAMGIPESTARLMGLNTKNELKIITAYVIRHEILDETQPFKADGKKIYVSPPTDDQYNRIELHGIEMFTKKWGIN